MLKTVYGHYEEDYLLIATIKDIFLHEELISQISYLFSTKIYLNHSEHSANIIFQIVESEEAEAEEVEIEEVEEETEDVIEMEDSSEMIDDLGKNEDMDSSMSDSCDYSSLSSDELSSDGGGMDSDAGMDME